jgi:hypothetical protein
MSLMVDFNQGQHLRSGRDFSVAGHGDAAIRLAGGMVSRGLRPQPRRSVPGGANLVG